MQNGENERKTLIRHDTVLELNPLQFLDSTASRRSAKDKHVALLILNSPISSFKHFESLYNTAGTVICADAGADRLHDLVTSKFSDLAYDVAIAKFLPHIIDGDLDSISNSVKHAYAAQGVKIIHDSDQYSTDFGKSVKTALKHQPAIRDVLVLGSLGGRVDQGIGLLHELYREQCSRHEGIRFWLVTEASISTMLVQGTTRLATNLSSGVIEENIGILPIYGPAVISTSGLEWDVEDWKTEMGGMVSTSNHIKRDFIEITTNGPVLFTVELKK